MRNLQHQRQGVLLCFAKYLFITVTGILFLMHFPFIIFTKPVFSLLMGLIRNIYNTLSESGVSKAQSEEGKSKIRYLNQGIVLGTLMFIPDLVFEAVIGFAPATILNCVFVVSAIVCFFINRQGSYNLSRNFALIGLDLILLTANFTEGTQTGNYLIYTSLVLMFPILFKLREKAREVAFPLIFTLVCAVASVTICPVKGHLPGLDEKSAALMFKGSFLVSAGLAAILAFIIYNITRKRELELIKAKELAEESARVKLQFISTMSHELRTPLNGIIGTTNLLRLGEHTAQQKEQYELLSYSSQHILHLVNDVLDFSKIESGKIQLENRDFNLLNFVQNIYTSFAPQFEQKRLYFRLQHNEDNLNYTVNTDDIRLAQILNNLLSNALKFTETGGVTLGIAITSPGGNKICITFDVKDTGIGINQESLAAIFDSFVQADANTTRKYGGTGLGLAISKRLAELFGTTLSAESEPGKGSHFSFSPVLTVTENQNSPVYKDEAEFNSLKGMNILIAEDNKINMLIARKFLLKWGVNLTEASNGKEAIELGGNTSFHLVLLDLEMPEADGFTALAEIRKRHPGVPAIAFTASVFENMEESLFQRGFNDYVLKPFTPHDLNAKLHKQQQLLLTV
jgi:signal transduction histidine kinase/CheY-like chemotaxis protein